MGYLNPETMFILSLKPEMREKLTDTVEEAVQLRSSGMTTEEIARALEQDIVAIERSSVTPKMVRHIVLGSSLETGN